jgi:hypothetical protein
VLSQRSAQCDPCRSLPVDAAGWSVAIGRSTRGCGGARGLFFRARMRARSTSRTGVRGGCALPLASAFTLGHLFVGALGRVAPCSMLPFLHAILRRLYLYLRLTCSYRPAGRECAKPCRPQCMIAGATQCWGQSSGIEASSIEQTDTVHTTCATSVDTRLVLTP